MVKVDASMEKENSYVGKASLLALKPNLPCSYEESFGPFPIVEETRDMRDPAVTINDANP